MSDDTTVKSGLALIQEELDSLGPSSAAKIGLIERLLGRPESVCDECGQIVPEEPALITKEQAQALLGFGSED